MGCICPMVVGPLPEEEFNAKTPRRQGAGAQRFKLFIPIQFFAPLRLCALALNSPQRRQAR